MIRHCEHVKTSGRFCASPAMRGRNYCFFHLNLAGQRLRAEQFAAEKQVNSTSSGQALRYPQDDRHLPALPPLEDAASIQIALMQVTEWLLRGMIDHRTAGLVLYSLQTASCNLRNMQQEAEADANKPICNRYDSFEQDYELEDCEHLRFDDPADQAEVEAAEKARAALQNGSVDAKADKAKYDDVTRLIAEGEARGYLSTKGAYRLEKEVEEPREPRMISDREYENKTVHIPLNLSQTQYLQAKSSIEEYEEKHNIDAEHPRGRKPAPQRAAISQKIFMGARKPAESVKMEEDSESCQLSVASCPS
jgi:hypothetical protein